MSDRGLHRLVLVGVLLVLLGVVVNTLNTIARPWGWLILAQWAATAGLATLTAFLAHELTTP